MIYRVRHDRVDKAGVVTLRYLSRLHHIGLGADYRGLAVHLLVANKNIRVIREDGRLDPRTDPRSRRADAQPLGTPNRPPKNRALCPETGGHHHLRHHNGWGGRIRTSDWLIQNQLPYHLATPQRRPSSVPDAPRASCLPPRQAAYTGQ